MTYVVLVVAGVLAVLVVLYLLGDLATPRRLHLMLANPWRIRGTIVTMRGSTSSYKKLPMNCVLAPGWAAAGVGKQLLALTCPRCGAPLPPAVTTQAVVCSYCSTPVVHEIPTSGPKLGEVFVANPISIQVAPDLDGQRGHHLLINFDVAAWAFPEFTVGRTVTLFGQRRGKSGRLDTALEMLGFVDEGTASRAEATVVSCLPGAGAVQESAHWLELGLALDGDSGSRRTLKGLFPESLLKWFAPGSRLPVLIDPGDDQSIAVDWSRALGPVVAAEGNVLVSFEGDSYPAHVDVFARSDADKLFCVTELVPGEWIELERLSLPNGKPLTAFRTAAAAA